MSRRRRGRRRARWIAFGLLVLGAASLWIFRASLLTSAARLLVAEDPWAPADLAAVLSENRALDAAVSAEAVRAGYVPRVLLLVPAQRPDEALLQDLQIAVLRPHEVATLVLLRLGVPREAIVIEPLPRRGTNAAVQTVARYARNHGVKRLIVVTARSHTRRAGILTRRALGPGTTVIVRASPRDDFHPEGWWRDRDQAREVMIEGLRWLNSLVLGDLW